MKKEGSDLEIKQVFLANAITDISAYIQLVDTKVSIIMAAVVAIIAGVASCYSPIGNVVKKMVPCSWVGVLFLIFTIFLGLSMISLFVFSISTLKGHKSIVNYRSRWFLAEPMNKYSFDDYLKDIREMSEEDVIDNMAAELYKLNDINRQKMKSFKLTMVSFVCFLILLACICFLFLVELL